MSIKGQFIECDNIREIESIITNQIDEITFIALVISSWHLDNLLAYLKYSKLTHGILIIVPQSNINDKSKFRLLREDIEPNIFIFDKIIFSKSTLNLSFDFYSVFKNMFHRIDRKQLLFINPGKPYLKLILSLRLYTRSISFVSIDEGLGTYVPVHEFESQNATYFTIVQSRINHKVVDLISYHILKHVYSFHLYSFDSNRKALIPNLSVSNNLFVVYSERYSQILKEQETIIIFKDFEYVNSDFIDNLFLEVLTLLSPYNIKIVIKKHPNDTRITFNNFVAMFRNVEVINNNKSGEELVSEIRPLFIIGGFSTVLFSSSTIFNCKAVSYMLLYKNIDLTKQMERHLDFFFEKFQYNTNIVFPTSISQLLSECSKILI